MIKISDIFPRFLTFAFIIFFGIFLVQNPDLSIIGVKSGINMCLNVIVPSLFPFIFFSSLMINSGIFNTLGKIFSPISKYLFSLPPPSSSVILLSLIGGFPVGAKGIKDLFEKDEINSEQAERMLMFCVNAGPAFILGVIGNSLIKNMNIANIILISQIVSSLIIATFLGFLSRKKNNNINFNLTQNKKINFAECIINSCESSSMSMIYMCTLIIIFNIFSYFLDNLQITSHFSKILLGFGFSNEISICFPQMIFEVTKACQLISNNGAFPYLLSFATSWGGLCVHFQIFSVIKNLKINYLKFFLFRLLNACLSSCITFILVRLQNLKFDIKTIEIPQTSTHILGSISLICCCVVFLLDLNLNKKFQKN